MKTKIQSDMTAEPISITIDVTIEDAQELMRAWGSRHLPVVDGTKLVGVISDRDIFRAYALHKSGKTEVREVMTKSPYNVRQDTNVAEVARIMAENKFGCAVVTDSGDHVVGIFTTTDALKLLARILNEPREVDFRVLQLQEYLIGQKRAS